MISEKAKQIGDSPTLKVAAKAQAMKAPVRSYMSRKLVTGTPATTLREIEELFYRHGIGHLPIMDGGSLVGLVTRADYLRAAGRADA